MIKSKPAMFLGTFEVKDCSSRSTTMVIVLNTADYASVTPVAEKTVFKGDAVIELKLKLI